MTKNKKKNRLQKVLFLLLLLIITLCTFRGCIYRSTISYKESGSRKQYSVKEKAFAAFIEDQIPSDFDGKIESIVNLSLKITNKTLSYNNENKENNPNKTFLLKRANNLGYATFTSTIGQYLIDKYKLSEVWEVKPVKAKLYIFGTEAYSKTKSNKFKDNNFVIFLNKVTKRKIAADPSIYRTLKINRVSIY